MRDKSCFDLLTERELEICGMIAQGLKSEHIAKLLHLSLGTVRNNTTVIIEKTNTRNRTKLAAKYIAEYAHIETDVDPSNEPGLSPLPSAKLRLVGLSGLPDEIPLIFQNMPFVIGRFDVRVGNKQCDFEFAKATKAVSRRHASFVRTACGYAVEDLNSRAGTFVNGKRVMPGELCPIKTGDRVLFGNAGAEYVFEG